MSAGRGGAGDAEGPFARLPAPPYCAAIFSSSRAEGGDGYDETAARMLELARAQPGFLGVESARDADGFGITVSCRESEEAIRAWRMHAGHAAARRRGRAEWYRLSSCASPGWSARMAGTGKVAGTRRDILCARPIG